MLLGLWLGLGLLQVGHRFADLLKVPRVYWIKVLLKPSRVLFDFLFIRLHLLIILLLGKSLLEHVVRLIL